MDGYSGRVRALSEEGRVHLHRGWPREDRGRELGGVAGRLGGVISLLLLMPTRGGRGQGLVVMVVVVMMVAVLGGEWGDG